jgi:transcription-repair coupling factor (superfamily II helicase)
VKEKLKALKVNVDTLTLTATPIPRTLQFSLMGARDLSILTTPPPNRYPVATEVCTYDDDIIRTAITDEINRNGQVFFINNRVQNIYLIEQKIRTLVPEARIAIAHGQMPTEQLEQTIIDFIDYEYDVLIATSVIESGVDIPNVNTIIVNNAHMFGLSDLHQLRGRVGRSNRKAFCYLIAPPLSMLTSDARRRLQAIETFAELGSGFPLG